MGCSDVLSTCTWNSLFAYSGDATTYPSIRKGGTMNLVIANAGWAMHVFVSYANEITCTVNPNAAKRKWCD